MNTPTVCLALFFDGDDFDIVCVGSESECKSAIREYGRANAEQQRGQEAEARSFHIRQRPGKPQVRGSFDIQ